MRKLLILVLLLTALVMLTQAQDGVPDNCEYVADTAHQFARYEPQNRRLVLADWRTGDDVQVIASDIDNTILLGWSPDCRYLAGAVGTPESMDTVVWDVTTGERMGSVNDAHLQPHVATWGPNNYIVVETRNGAILWHVPTYHQTILTTHFDPVTVRNFSRLRWDAANHQLIANLSGAGRVVYDLNTGEEVPEVAERTDTTPGNADSQQIIGSAAYDCRTSRRVPYNQATNIRWFVNVHYNKNTRQIAAYLNWEDEILVLLENDIAISSFSDRNWSADCRYYAASLGRVGEDVSDTYVWDVTTGERVGILPDARRIMHPLYWHPSLPVLLIETRNGAVLWNLPSNTQVTLDTGAETALAGRSNIRNFSQYSWGGNVLFLAPIREPNSVQVYDINTSILLSSITLDSPVTVITASNSGSYAVLCCEPANQFVLWNRETGVLTPVPEIRYVGYHFNPSDTYLLGETRAGLNVWTLPDAPAPAIYEGVSVLGSYQFLDDVTIRGEYSNIQVNLQTGEVIRLDGLAQSPLTTTPLEGESGFSTSWYPYPGYDSACGKQIYFNGQVGSDIRIGRYAIYEGDRLLLQIVGKYPQLSPDCRWVSSEVPLLQDNRAYDNAPIDDRYRERVSDNLVFWNVDTGEIVHSFYHPYRAQTNSRVRWSVDAQFAIVQTTEGAFLYNPSADTAPLLLFNDNNDAIRTYFTPYWDYERGQVLIDGWSAIYAFDLTTGALRYEVTARPDSAIRCQYWGCGFRVMNEQYLIVQSYGTMGVYNLDTLAAYYVQKEATPRFNIWYSHLHMSPSERYIVTGRRAGVIVVWELNSVSELSTPYHIRLRNSGNGFQSLRFIDDETVEITQTDGTTYQLSLIRVE